MQEIICLLDGSGSMCDCTTDSIGSFNTFIKEQKDVGEANLTVIWFDHEFRVAYEGLLSAYPELTTWPCRGSTALYDAVGKTFNHVRERFTKESPEKVILAILTDGEENASKEFSQQKAMQFITEHQDKYGWLVMMLAIDSSAWGMGASLGVKASNVYNVTKNPEDLLRGYGSVTVASTSYRVDPNSLKI